MKPTLPAGGSPRRGGAPPAPPPPGPGRKRSRGPPRVPRPKSAPLPPGARWPPAPGPPPGRPRRCRGRAPPPGAGQKPRSGPAQGLLGEEGAVGPVGHRGLDHGHSREAQGQILGFRLFPGVGAPERSPRAGLVHESPGGPVDRHGAHLDRPLHPRRPGSPKHVAGPLQVGPAALLRSPPVAVGAVDDRPAAAGRLLPPAGLPQVPGHDLQGEAGQADGPGESPHQGPHPAAVLQHQALGRAPPPTPMAPVTTARSAP